MKVEWMEWDPVGPATPEQIIQVEARVGHQFPEDLRTTLLKHQGMVPQPDMLVLREGRPRACFGALRHCVEGKAGYIAQSLTLWREEGYPPYLVPISSAQGGPHFALDYRAGEDNPAIVYVLPEWGGRAPDDPEEDDPDDFIIPVASSFTKLLQMMQD